MGSEDMVRCYSFVVVVADQDVYRKRRVTLKIDCIIHCGFSHVIIFI